MAFIVMGLFVMILCCATTVSERGNDDQEACHLGPYDDDDEEACHLGPQERHPLRHVSLLWYEALVTGEALMSIFGDIWDKITGAAAAIAPAAAATEASAPSAAPAAELSGAPSTGASGAATPSAMSEVDVEAVLIKIAAQKGGDDNWRTSIVDLLKLLDLDSSLAARTILAHELDVHAGADGSAEQNIALHRAVVQKMEENGGKVPASMKD